MRWSFASLLLVLLAVRDAVAGDLRLRLIKQLGTPKGDTGIISAEAYIFLAEFLEDFDYSGEKANYPFNMSHIDWANKGVPKVVPKERVLKRFNWPFKSGAKVVVKVDKNDDEDNFVREYKYMRTMDHASIAKVYTRGKAAIFNRSDPRFDIAGLIRDVGNENIVKEASLRELLKDGVTTAYTFFLMEHIEGDMQRARATGGELTSYLPLATLHMPRAAQTLHRRHILKMRDPGRSRRQVPDL